MQPGCSVGSLTRYNEQNGTAPSEGPASEDHTALFNITRSRRKVVSPGENFSNFQGTWYGYGVTTALHVCAALTRTEAWVCDKNGNSPPPVLIVWGWHRCVALALLRTNSLIEFYTACQYLSSSYLIIGIAICDPVSSKEGAFFLVSIVVARHRHATAVPRV